MKEMIKNYYDFLLSTSEEFRELVEETDGLSASEMCAKYNILIENELRKVG